MSESEALRREIRVLTHQSSPKVDLGDRRRRGACRRSPPPEGLSDRSVLLWAPLMGGVQLQAFATPLGARRGGMLPALPSGFLGKTWEGLARRAGAVYEAAKPEGPDLLGSDRFAFLPAAAPGNLKALNLVGIFFRNNKEVVCWT